MTKERVWELFKYAFFGVYAETILSDFGEGNRHSYTRSYTHHNSGENSGGGATGGGGAGRSF